MSRFSLTLSLLPVLAVPSALLVSLPHLSLNAVDAEIPVLYQAPLPTTDPIHVHELIRLRSEIAACEHTAGHPGLPYRLHSNLSEEYRLIVRETTPEAIRQAGLPLDVR